MAADAKDGKLRLKIDGPGVGPDTLDPLATLELARSYLQLLQKVSQDLEIKLELTGLRVESGSAALAFTPTNPRLAEEISVQAHRMVSGEVLIPPRLEGPTHAFASAVRALPKEQSVSVLVGPRKLLVVPREPAAVAPRRSVTTIRALLVSIGGLGHPTARFVSKSEERTFALRLESQALAQQLARFIYRDLDIVAELHRDEDGIIVGGHLTEFREVPRGDPLSAWKRWYEAVASEWDEVDDIEAELGRLDEGLEPDA